MEDRSSSGKRQSTSIRVTPSKPDEKRERRGEGEQRGTLVKKPLLFGSKTPEKIQLPKIKVSCLIFLCVCVFVPRKCDHRRIIIHQM